jgi:hypothetical protein
MATKSKGTSYRALTNISLGKSKDGTLHAPVKAGDVFSLDDDDVAEDLLAKGAISKTLKPTEEEIAAASVDSSDVNKGEPPNAAMTRGMDADAKIAGKEAPEGYANTGTEAAKKQQDEVQGSAKGASANGPGKSTSTSK